MKAKELMTTNPRTCELNESLAEAAKIMWDFDCGMLPVLKDGKELVGVITDRDICMGAAMRDRSAGSISVEEVMTGGVYSVKPDDDVTNVLEMMKAHKVRRLPVVDDQNQLQGMISVNDLTLHAEEKVSKKTPEVSFGDVVATYKAICAHPMSTENSEQSMRASV